MIEEIEPRTAGGIPMVDIRGPGPESLLTKAPIFHPIGALEVTDSTLAAAVEGPRSETLAANAPQGVENVILSDTDSGDVGQEIRITMTGGAGVHVTQVTARVLVDTTFHLILADRMPAAALSGAAVSIRKRKVKPQTADIEKFTPGVEAWVTLNGGTVFKTLVADAVDETGAITLRDGLTAAASSGNSCDARAYSGTATDDVTQIIGYMPGTWSVDFQTGNGTAAGSTHVPEGESVFDLLSSLAERSGEFFRLKIVNHIPYYALQWRRTPDASGVMLVMYSSGEEWQQETDETNASRGALISVRHKTAQPLINRIYPAAGDQAITLAACTSGALAAASAAGCSVHLSTDFYEPDYVQYDASIPIPGGYGARAVRQTFGDISIADSESLEELQNASDALLAAAVQALTQARLREYYTVEASIPAVALAPGQTVRIFNDVIEPIVDQANYVILDITERQVQGVPRTTLTVSNILGPQVNAATNFAKTVRSLVQSARRSGGAGAAISVAAGGGSGGGVTDHGLLTGLTDDDHPQYLLASGARALAGNLAVNAGATIDGVDISAHAANADAHHARVYAADASMTVNTGQGISVAGAFAGAGLALSGGIASVNVAAAQGTGMTGDTVAVVPAPAGGLELAAAGVQVKRPANSGIAGDATGIYLAPGTIGALSVNSLSGSSHFHAVLSTENAKTTPSQLLKSSAAGDLTLRYLTADQITTPLLLTASGSLRIDPAAALTVHDGDLQFVGARTISTDTGSLTLAPSGGLFIDPPDNNAQIQPSVTLKTAHWVSGFLGTGWGLTYAGHLDTRSIYADELHVAAFIADTARVAVGAEYITPGMAIIAASFTIPAVGSGGTLYVEDAPGLTDLPVFADGDWVLLRVMDRPSGGLLVANAWGQVYGYADRNDGQQQWTFTTRSVDAAAVGERAPRGAIALDFGKSGDGWWWVTTLDPAGSPYAGITTWTGANPYTDGNRTHRLRMGQLSGVSGAHEWGLQAGNLMSSFVRFSDLRSEIHGSRLSLYAADGGQLRVGAVDVTFYRTAGQSSLLTPNADHSVLNIETSGATFWGMVDEGGGTPNYGDYIRNAYNLPGYVFLGLSNPAAFTTIFRVDIRAAVQSTGLTNDKIRLYGQIFQQDETTPLTGEVLLWEATANSSTTRTITAPHEGYDADKPGQWNNARLRLRWEYEISASEEAIRLDPNVPSLAIGNPLPTGVTTGGAGLWAGLEGGAYQTRLGNPTGSRLVYDGTSLQLVSGSTGAAISLNPTAQYIALGNPLPTGRASGGDGFWLGLESGLYQMRIGKTVGESLRWTGAELALMDRNNFRVFYTNADGSYFGAPIQLGASGGIWQGSGGTFGTPQAGWKLWNDAGRGRFTTYNATGTVQVDMDSAGRLIAGAGGVKLERDGIKVYDIASGDEVLRVRGQGIEFIDTVNFEDSRGIRFFRSATEYGFVQGRYASTNAREVLARCFTPSTMSAEVSLQAQAGALSGAVQLFVSSGGSFISLDADNVDPRGALRPLKPIRWLPVTAKPTTPTGYADLYAYQTGSNVQLIWRNKNGAEVVIATVPAA